MFSDYLDTIAFVSKYDPQVGEAMQAELKKAAQESGAYRFGEYRLARRHGGNGQRADQ